MKRRIFGILLALSLLLSGVTLLAPGALAASQMQVSDACLDMIQSIEGFRAIPYWDYSQWTVGFGTECPQEDLDRYKKEGIPLAEALALFDTHIEKYEKAVNKFIDKHGLTLSQTQFDALVSYTYNLGSGSLNKESYTIVQALLSGARDNELIYAFSVYCMAGGEFQPGLMRRRLAEANLFLHGVYDEYPPESYGYVHYDANGGVRDASAQGYDCNMAAVPMSRPTRDGYTFVGWYTKAEGGVKITSLDETHRGMTLYAHWEEGVVEVEHPTVPAEGINVTVKSGLVHLRSGPGVAYGITADVSAGQILTVTGTTMADGELWGKCEAGWICLSHTNYDEIVQPGQGGGEDEKPLQLPVYATVVVSDGVTVYNGPHSTYPELRTLSKGKVVLLEEYVEFDGRQWGRYEGGWIRLDMDVLIHDEYTLAHSFTLKATETLAVRQAPGVENEKLTTLKKGNTTTVYAIAYVDGTPWGRIAKGWVNLTYSDFDEALYPQYQSHSFGDWYTATPATCITPGTEHRDCRYCDRQESRETALGDHSFDAWQLILQPTCTADGQEQRSCTLCGHVEERAVSAIGHSMTDWTQIQAPTCEAAGQEQRSCTLCEHTETRPIEALSHSYTAWEEIKTPTAQEPGQERRECKVCGYVETRELPPTEHTFGPWYELQAPTCLDTGLERRDCQTCEHYEERELEPTGHSLTAWSVAQAPTCTEAGQECRACQHCGHYESRALDATGHSYGQWYVAVKPTVEEYGQERRDCANCDSFETRQLDKLPPVITRTYATVTCDVLRIRSGPGTGYSQVGKLYRDDRVEILETQDVGRNVWGRTEKGWICMTGYVKLETVEEGPHTQHSYGDWYEILAPTTTACGTERRDCTLCGHYETREIPMLENALVEKVYATVTCDSLTIRSGAGSGYARLGKILTGTRVEILEQVTKKGVVWGRTATGWIWLSGYTTLETVSEEATPEAVTMTVTASSLKIRFGPGSSHDVCGYLYENTQVLVYETVTVDGTTWARVAEGWISAEYLK